MGLGGLGAGDGAGVDDAGVDGVDVGVGVLGYWVDGFVLFKLSWAVS